MDTCQALDQCAPEGRSRRRRGRASRIGVAIAIAIVDEEPPQGAAPHGQLRLVTLQAGPGRHTRSGVQDPVVGLVPMIKDDPALLHGVPAAWTAS